MQLNKDTNQKTEKNIPFKYNDEICLEDECISYEKVKQLKTFFPYGTVLPFSGGEKIKYQKDGLFAMEIIIPQTLDPKFILGSSDSKQLTGGNLKLDLNPHHLPEHQHDIFLPSKATDKDDIQPEEKTFSKEYKYTYLSGYAKPSPEVLYDTLDEAKEAAKKNQGVGGITYEPKEKKYFKKGE